MHSDPQYFARGIDLVVEAPQSYSIDLKVDSYIGSNPERKIRGMCNPDSKMILIETLSQLQYDRKKEDIPGWFFTSNADEVFYYYLALLNEPNELNPIYSLYKEAITQHRETEAIEDQLIRSLKVDRDLLVTYDLKKARLWYTRTGFKLPISWSGAPNPTYVTVSRRIPRSQFLEPEGPGRNLGSIYAKVA